MNRTRILTTVSALALTAGVTAGAYAAAVPNLAVDLTSPTLTTTTQAGSLQSTSIVSASNGLTAIGAVNSGSLGSNVASIGGVGNTANVDANVFTATAIGNQLFSEFDAGAVTGVGPSDNGGLALSTSSNVGGTTFSATISGNAHVNDIDIDAGASGNTFTLDGNTLQSSTTGNESITNIGVDITGTGIPAIDGTVIDGDVTLLYNSAEQGGVTVDAGAADEYQASASLLASTVQVNAVLEAAPATDETFALVTGSNITITVDDDDAVDGENVVGSAISAQNNTIGASITGNEALTQNSLTNGNTNSFSGSAGASTVQINADAGDEVFNANITDSSISAGTTTDAIEDLDGGMVTFVGNTLQASAQANTSVTSLTTSGLTIAGPNETAAAFGNVSESLGDDSSTVTADLFAANAQLNDFDTLASIDDGSELRVQTLSAGDGAGSTITVTGNTANASASGNAGTTSVDVNAGGDPAARVEAIAAINSSQFNTGEQTATNEALLAVNVAPTSADLIAASTINVSGNELSSNARGNEQSSSLAVSATTIDSDVFDATPGASSTNSRSTETISVDADFSVLSTQILETGASMISNTTGAVDVDFGDGGADVDNAELIVSDNRVSAEAIGNLSTEASLTLTGTTEDGEGFTGAVTNLQSVEDDVVLQAIVDPTAVTPTDIIDVDSDATSFTFNSLDVDNNTITATIYGNLADGSTNSLSVTGNRISDNGQTLPLTTVDRSGSLVPNTTSRAGFRLVNDQGIEDIGTVIASISDTEGEFISVSLVNGGANTLVITDSDVSVDENTVRGQVNLNDATSVIALDGNSVDASSALVNTQSVIAQSAATSAEVFVIIEGDIDLTVLASGTAARNTLTTNDNTVAAIGQLNVADNDLSVTANTQTLSETSGIGAATLNTQLGSTGVETSVIGENSITNDQVFESLRNSGLNVSVSDTNIEIDFGTADGNLETSTVAADDNTLQALAQGNVTANDIDLDVNTFDLTGAEEGSTAARGPVATIGSNQQGLAPDEGAIDASIANTLISVNADDVDDDILTSELTADGNTITSMARANFADNGSSDPVTGDRVNGIVVSGTTFTPADAEETRAEVEVGGGVDLEITNASFAIGNRQVNDLSVFSSLTNTDIDVSTVSANATDEITGSTISASSNVLLSQARSNDAVNAIELDFVTNEAAAFIANYQGPVDATVSVASNIVDVDISADANVGDGATGLSGTDVSVDNNQILSLASANRVVNELFTSGTTLGGSTAATDTLPEVEGTFGLAPFIANVDYGIINRQGTVGDASHAVQAQITNTTIEFESAGIVNSSSLSADSNALLAQSIISDADNTLRINADPADNGANVGSADDPVSAAILSRQIEETSTSEAAIANTQIGSVGSVEDIDSEESVSISIDGNRIEAEASIGAADNVLTVDAGANIIGLSGTGGDGDNLDTSLGLSLNADYSALNQQSGSGTATTSSVGGGLQIGANIGTEAVGDSVTVDNNLVESEAIGFRSLTGVVLTAGANLDVTAQASNRQSLIDSTQTASLTGAGPGVDGIGLDLAGPEASLDSSLSVSNNDLIVNAQGLVATTIVNADAGANLASTATEDGPTALGAAGLLVDNALLTAASVQVTVGGGTFATLGGGGLGVGISAPGLTGSSLDVVSNDAIATATGNQALNSVVAGAAAGMAGGDGLSLEIDSGVTTAVADADLVAGNAQVLISGATDPAVGVTVSNLVFQATTAGALDAASISVDGNRAIGQAIGNDATTTVAINAGIGNDLPSAAVLSSQTTQNATITSTVSGVTIGATGITGATGSSVSVSGNTVGSTAIGNRSFSSIGASN
ncbi:MAG: beta strand repeat-containing protein [Alphaproteobacteria bacterium]